MIRGIHHIAIHTKNFDRICSFYVEAFGFTPVIDEVAWSKSDFFDSVIGLEGTAGRVIMLQANNMYLEVWEYTSPQGKEAAALNPNDLGYTHFSVDTDNIEDDYKRLVAAGMTFHRTVPDETDGIRAVYGRDPDGRLIELQYAAPDHVFSLERLKMLRLKADQ
ncbi:glyoxalase-like domain protein [Ochrobactrum quorumnocens]|uniref:Glyoxalase-like domain protein n=1 Tax=Ochrobactrum quorumnocens TaxID=271865 RepID=A0A248UDX6_9HYPH|nr:VOC family protein [[Ochrobactrum] quorumnocens]ASV84866.1 glyoxalase-like domain protein [[Ochrobactrum] quorumnocens]